MANRNDAQVARRWGITKIELWQRRADGLKGCRLCRDWLPLSAYTIDASRGDGLRTACSACDAADKRRGRR